MIIADRKAGKSGSFKDGSNDMLGMLLESDFYKTRPELIIDEIITFFIAGLKTVQISSANLVMYLDLYPEVKKKLLAEMLPVMEEAKDNIV